MSDTVVENGKALMACSHAGCESEDGKGGFWHLLVAEDHFASRYRFVVPAEARCPVCQSSGYPVKEG